MLSRIFGSFVSRLNQINGERIKFKQLVYYGNHDDLRHGRIIIWLRLGGYWRSQTVL